jgi:ParB family transcriptional regulator, chromosome partitioning protein
LELEISQLVLRYSPLRVMDPGRVAWLAASIGREGQRTPVILAGENVLVDGYHRVAALQSLGRDLVQGTRLELTEAEALVMTWRLGTGRRKTALEEGWLLAELMDRHERSQTDLMREMQRPAAWVSDRLGLVRVLPESVQEAVRRCRIPAHGAMKSLVPLARRDRDACERLVQGLKEPVTDRQVERLWRAWRKADAEGRARIEAHPELLLKAEESVCPLPPDEEEKLASDFEGIAGLCRRARKGVRGGVFPRGNDSVVHRAWEQARGAFEALVTEVERAGS